MSDSEETAAHHKETKSKEKRASVSSEGSDEQTPDSTEDSKGEKVEVPYDPNAKPSKSILKKPGEESHKSDSHIHIESTDDAEHDAEKKKAPKKPMPVEGRTGVVMAGKKKGAIGGASSSSSDSSAAAPKKEEAAPAPSSKTDKSKDDKKDKKEKEKKAKEEKKDKKEKEKKEKKDKK